MNESQIKIKMGFVGAGRVGCSLGKYLKESAGNFSLLGYCSKRPASAHEAAALTESRAYGTLLLLAAESDVLFITTPDGAIASVWQELCAAGIDLTGKIIVHCSGSLASTVFAGAEARGVTAASLHPLYAVSDCETSYKTIGNALFTLEGSGARLEEFDAWLRASGLTLQRIDASAKISYHAAAVVASNLMVGLTEVSIELLENCGFDRAHARMALRPLMEGNLTAIMEKDTVQALTGPAERADVQTVTRHLQALSGENREIYRLLTKKAVALAKQKHSLRDYTALDVLLDS